jgi:hypothetical protein
MIKMFRYLRDTIAELPADMNGEKLTPAVAHLFHVGEDTEKLGDEKAEFSTTVWPSCCFCANGCGLIFKLQLLSCAPECKRQT